MNLKQETAGVIQQIGGLLERLDDKMYAESLDIFSNSSIGQHIRHIYEFYDCLVHGAATGVVNYDKRERNLQIQSETTYCNYAFQELLPAIENLDIQQEVKIEQGVDLSDQLSGETIQSSTGRELMYALEHAIHHLAIIKMGLRIHFPDFQVDENLGVAPSTIEYRKACVQ